MKSFLLCGWLWFSLSLSLSVFNPNVVYAVDNDAASSAQIEIDALLKTSQDNWGKSSDVALTTAEEAFNKALKINDIKRQAQALRLQSVAYWYKDDYPMVVKKADQALTLFKQIDDKQGIAAALNTIATTHLNLYNLELAKKSYLEALAIAQEINDVNRQATVLQNLGTVAIGQEDLALAEDYLLQALEIRASVPDTFAEMTIMANLASVYRRQMKLGQSFTLLDQLITIAQQENNATRLADAYADYGTTHFEAGNYAEAVVMYQNALAIAQEHELLRIEEAVSNGLRQSYELLNDYQKAYTAFEQYSEIREARLNEKNNELLAELDAKYEAEKSRALILEQKAALESERFASTVYMIAFIFAVIIAVALYYVYKLKKAAADVLHAQSRTDNLTGLNNRRAFNDIIADGFKHLQQHNTPMSIVLIDIDNFKSINDTYGHVAGDKVLETMSELVSQTARSIDICARWGGEEFILYLPNTDSNVAQKVAERIRVAVEEALFTLPAPHAALHITMTAGVAQANQSDDLEALTERADQALYQGKTSGKNKVVVSQ
ncbi:tetratricopeptide repeat-containing diguanylate cyclase [Alteromonas facilis]|uniref:tetratricopeptide repeat-containing diguanylate cyclase n=1 Tax=Alteromonas facilis TaxID=2048004 RepID=UPI000C283489|nr:tetratricopeptide repeat-containing diguanylate cyclase [Alteromonas facilis]